MPAGLTNIQTRLVAADEPGLPPGSFDLVVLCQVDHYLKDRVVFLRKLRDALRPGGRIVVMNYAPFRAADANAGREATLRTVTIGSAREMPTQEGP